MSLTGACNPGASTGKRCSPAADGRGVGTGPAMEAGDAAVPSRIVAGADFVAGARTWAVIDPGCVSSV